MINIDYNMPVPSVLEAHSSSEAPVFGFEGYTVFPGFCDVHVHFREPGFSYKEEVLMDQKKTGKFLKELRKEKGITQEEFAEMLNVSGRTESRW